MSIAHLLEDFTSQVGGGALHLLDEEALEEQRLIAFERGYGAGWDDATQAQDAGRDKFTGDLSAALADVSFTYHEALTRMTVSLEPMFESLVQAVLPEALDQSFARRLIEQLVEMARNQIAQPIQLRVPEGTAALIDDLLLEDLPSKALVVEDPGLMPGQAALQVEQERREIDHIALLSTIAAAFDAYLFEAKEALTHD